MMFEMTPACLTKLLKPVAQGLRGKKRTALKVRLSVRDHHVSIIGNGVEMREKASVQGEGQCVLGWKRITEVLSTFPAENSLQFDCQDSVLKIGSFSMPIESYSAYSDLPSEPIPPPEVAATRKKVVAVESEPAKSGDGFSPTAPPRSYTDRSGMMGSVSPEDTKEGRGPLVCAGCGSVGFFEKHEFVSSRTSEKTTFYRRFRTWVPAAQAEEFVIITGKEEKGLCPECTSARAHGQGRQTDLFDRR